MNTCQSFIRILSLIGLTWTIAEAVQKCQPIRLANGRARTQRQGRQVRFRCLKGYEFVGRRYMNCFLGQWDFERDPSIHPPMCVKPGCRASSYVNGHFLETYKGAVVSVVCNLGYTLIGSSTVYCNGEEWNQPFPECKAIDPSPQKSCDFEESLCGWTQDPYGDWRWHKSKDSDQERDGNCLPLECTKSPPYSFYNNGNYMLLGNSSSKIANETESLFSPVFPPDYSNNSCFTFWYLMNGSTTGYLKVFVKPEGVELSNTIPPFWMIGNQGYKWSAGYFPLYVTEKPFQLVIEGMSLPGKDSVIAFDDVNILSGVMCNDFLDSYLPYYSKTEETFTDDFDRSCKNLCGMNSTDKCGCHESCKKVFTCCSDYDVYCVMDETTSSRETVITTTIEWESTSSGTTTPMEDSNEIPKKVSNDIESNIDAEVKTEAEARTTTVAINDTMTARTYKTTSRIILSREKTNPHFNFQIRVDPSRSVLAGRTRTDESIPDGRLHGAVKSDSDHSVSSGIPSGTVEAAVAVAALLVTMAVVTAFIRHRRRKRSEKESMVEDSDSICFGMNPIYEKLSSQSSLICIRPSGLLDGKTSEAGNHR